MENAKIIGLRVLIMSVILCIGVIAYKTKVISKDGTKQLSAIELKIINPLLIFMSYQEPFDTEKLHGLLWSFVLSAASFAVTIGLATVLKRKNGNENWSVERFSCIYSNCGFMGIPLIKGLYGNEGVLYLTAYITLFNLLVFTHGYMLMKEETDFSALVKAVRSPSVIAVFIGLICYVTRLRIDAVPAVGGVLSEALQAVADMNTPMAMLIAGATAAQTALLKTLTDRRILTTAASKLLIVPAAIILLMHFVPSGVPLMPRLIVCIACACPAATTGTMFALLLDKNAKRCSEIFALTTVASMATLPLIAAFASLLVR